MCPERKTTFGGSLPGELGFCPPVWHHVALAVWIPLVRGDVLLSLAGGLLPCVAGKDALRTPSSARPGIARSPEHERQTRAARFDALTLSYGGGGGGPKPACLSVSCLAFRPEAAPVHRPRPAEAVEDRVRRRSHIKGRTRSFLSPWGGGGGHGGVWLDRARPALSGKAGRRREWV